MFKHVKSLASSADFCLMTARKVFCYVALMLMSLVNTMAHDMYRKLT